MKITVIGSGVYGKAIANLALHNGNDVTIWTEQEDITKVAVPEGVKITNSYKEAMKDAELVFILTSSKYTASICEGIRPYIEEDMLFILGSKGILEDGKLVNEEFEFLLPKVKYAIISGPTFAVDIAALEPVGFTLATMGKKDFERIVSAFKDGVKFEHSHDILGIEMAGSLKNAYAIGSGILSGFNYGHSIRCLYITAVLNEMRNIFKQVGAEEKTVLTLAGIGDLVLTCTSLNSRNFTFGSLLSLDNKKTKDEYLKKNTVEGYDNLKTYIKIFKDKKIDAPILFMIYDIVINNEDSEKLIDLILK